MSNTKHTAAETKDVAHVAAQDARLNEVFELANNHARTEIKGKDNAEATATATLTVTGTEGDECGVKASVTLGTSHKCAADKAKQ